MIEKNGNEADKIDNEFTVCRKCNRGKYIETLDTDFLNGVLHCSQCSHRIARYD